MEQKPSKTLFGGDRTRCSAKNKSRDYEKEKPSPFLKNTIRQPQSDTPDCVQKKGKSFLSLHNRVDFPLFNTVNRKFIYNLLP